MAFNECANTAQRFELVQEFYDPTYMYFKNHEVSSLNELLEKEPGKKPSIIKRMKEELMKMLDKSVIKHSIVHHVLYQFMVHADPASKSEMIEAVRDVVPEILHTKDGSRVGMHCVWYGTLKDRKSIIKSMKTFVTKIAMEEHGHMVLLALFHCFDDTVFLEKHIIKELINHLVKISENSGEKKKIDRKGKEVTHREKKEETDGEEGVKKDEDEKTKTDETDREEQDNKCRRDLLPEFLQNIHAKRVLIYLLNPKDLHYIQPDVINILKQGDDNSTSKKDPEIRQSELKAVIVGPLLNLIASNIERFYTNNAFCLFTIVILQHTVGNRRNAFKAIADLVAEPYTPENKNIHPIEHSGSHFMYKKLIVQDKDESKDDVKFSEVLIETVPQMVFKSWMECNRGAFLLVSCLKQEYRLLSQELRKN
ncbi:unnamed protein product [Larinioides sclopetarius]|uniref:CPL domain-containing protein n=1 Tax=Larinioides sclopetarius TaxID=280406 RepID=A0AAV1ZU18_9ARAC